MIIAVVVFFVFFTLMCYFYDDTPFNSGTFVCVVFSIIAMLLSFAICPAFIPIKTDIKETPISSIDLSVDTRGEPVYILRTGDEIIMKSKKSTEVEFGNENKLIERCEYYDCAWQYWVAQPCRSSATLQIKAG